MQGIQGQFNPEDRLIDFFDGHFVDSADPKIVTIDGQYWITLLLMADPEGEDCGVYSLVMPKDRWLESHCAMITGALTYAKDENRGRICALAGNTLCALWTFWQLDDEEVANTTMHEMGAAVAQWVEESTDK